MCGRCVGGGMMGASVSHVTRYAVLSISDQ